jgi:glucosamine-phosphate N-acetyltransferase
MLRNLKEKDLPECMELLKELTIVGEVDYLKVYEEISKNPNHYNFVYELENKIVGMATILIEQKFIHGGSRVGHIEDVVVSSKCRNLGIGKKLISKCLDIAKERKCYKVILDCNEENTKFYEKINFVKFGNSMKINFI